jgi:hypothetical protein
LCLNHIMTIWKEGGVCEFSHLLKNNFLWLFEIPIDDSFSLPLLK